MIYNVSRMLTISEHAIPEHQLPCGSGGYSAGARPDLPGPEAGITVEMPVPHLGTGLSATLRSSRDRTSVSLDSIDRISIRCDTAMVIEQLRPA